MARLRTHTRIASRFGVGCALWFISGCATVSPPRVDREISLEEASACWRGTLEKYVDSQGRVNFIALSKNRACLETFVSFVSRTGPTSHPDLFPTTEDKLAFHINAYNALSMYNVIDKDIPESLAGFKKVNFFFLRKFIVAGEKMSLYAYENDIIRKMGEERVHFALNCMSVGCPILPRIPFDGKTLNEVLEKQAKYFFSETRNLRVDRAQKKVFLSEILRFYTDDFLRKKPSLIDYVNQYTTDKIPADFEVEFIPYDWTINAQP